MAERISESLDISEHPEINGGYPVIGGTRVGVDLVVDAFKRVGSIDKAWDSYRGVLTRAQFRAGLRYYRNNPSRVDERISERARILGSGAEIYVHESPPTDSQSSFEDLMEYYRPIAPIQVVIHRRSS